MRNEGGVISAGTVGIASGETTSEAIPLHAASRGGIILPATFTGTAITFQVSHDGTTYGVLEDASGNVVTLTVAQALAYAIPEAVFGFAYCKLVSGSAEGGAREIAVNLKY